MYRAIAFKTIRRHCYHTEMYCIWKGATKTGLGGGCLTQITTTDIEIFRYNPSNRGVRSLPPSYLQPHVLNSVTMRISPVMNLPPMVSASAPTPPDALCSPTLASRESSSSTHTQTYDAHTPKPLGTVNQAYHCRKTLPSSIWDLTTRVSMPLSSAFATQGLLLNFLSQVTVQATINVPNPLVNFLKTPATPDHTSLCNSANIAVQQHIDVSMCYHITAIQHRRLRPLLFLIQLLTHRAIRHTELASPASNNGIVTTQLDTYHLPEPTSKIWLWLMHLIIRGQQHSL